MVGSRRQWFGSGVSSAAGKPIKAISRDLRLSRKVVRKAIRAGKAQFSLLAHDAAISEDRFRCAERTGAAAGRERQAASGRIG